MMVLQAFRASMVLQSSAYSLNMSLILFHAEPLMRAEPPPLLPTCVFTKNAAEMVKSVQVGAEQERWVWQQQEQMAEGYKSAIW